MSHITIDRLKTFQALSFQQKQEVITLGRPMPSINLEQEVRNGARTATRRFSLEYYEKVNWLCACSTINRLFCFPCILFSKVANAWTKTGYFDLVNFWKAVRKHDGSLSHKEACVCLARFGKERIESSLSRALITMRSYATTLL